MQPECYTQNRTSRPEVRLPKSYWRSPPKRQVDREVKVKSQVQRAGAGRVRGGRDQESRGGAEETFLYPTQVGGGTGGNGEGPADRWTEVERVLGL